MNLTATNQTLELVTSTANAVAWAASWLDVDKTGATVTTPGSNQGSVSAVATTVVVPAPASATVYRIVTGLTVFSSGGAQTPLVQKDVAGVNHPIARGVLSANEALMFEDGAGWYTLDASGQRKTVGSPGANGINGGGTILGSGTSIIDFGAGSSHTTLVVTGQPLILAGSLVYVWVRPQATVDHTADEHIVETIKVLASDVVAGVGFTIHGLNTSEKGEPALPESSLRPRFGGTGQDAGRGQAPRRSTNTVGGRGTVITGKWSVGWFYTQ